MRGVVVKEWTEFENLEIGEIDPPDLADNEVRIRTQAAGINFATSLRVRGQYQIKPALPHVPGNELAGVVIETGKNVTRFAPGDRVTCFVHWGAMAEEAVAPESNTYKIPDSMEFCRSIGMTSSYETTYAAFCWPQWMDVQWGETVLVHGAAGGVGISAVEIAKILGAKVIATVGSEEKARFVRDLGADLVINYREENFREKVLDFTNGEGVEQCYDPVGGDVFLESLRCMKPEGKIMPIGFASGKVPQIPANILLIKNIRVMGFNLGVYNGQWGKDLRWKYEGVVRDGMTQLFRWFEQGRINPICAGAFPLEGFREAMRMVLSREAIGRVALVLDEEAKRLGL